ncbi:membrane protein insertase YidC [Quisquiliibacterium transsilvanicum]|uniref:Membrane protein insertase YidC n=1 Tax=Quisquiliibacterium transsilvanicum TaxID=1549638 RepID=A0A7W8HKA6_9BURK|nr:membrane protein insertase YidC [Quisquiliibacterium transsilvanicum]MBB5272715.1 YidC/Oxa1 family membrane protein insertase [Quisquiliibacterium transsilvanicum]
MQSSQLQRTILWVVFSMSLLFLWDGWQRYNGKPSMFGEPPAVQADAGAQGKGATPPTQNDASIPAAPASAAGAAAVPGAAGAPAAGQPRLEPLKLRSDVLALEIDPVGGQVRRGELLKHKASEEAMTDTGNVVLLEEAPGRTYLAQSGLVGAPQGSSFPTHKSVFNVLEQGAGEGGAQQLKLVAESGGARLVRTYRLAPGAYTVDITDEVTNVGTEPMRPVLYMQLTRDGSSPPGDSKFYSTYTGPVVYTEAAKFQKVAFGDIEKGKGDHAKGAADGWAGIIQHYFVTAWIPTESATREFYTRKIDTNLYTVGATQPMAELAPGASASASTRLLIAPQDQRMLESVAPGLDLTVDYGWLTVIAKPIFWLLQWLHGIVGNWGWSIVLLTIVIKTMFFPLQAASYRSMARMKAVSPRLMQLRERYGSDRVKMNQAMMELYKEEKINPLGGCLPIVVQIPVFIALYWVLLASVEMRNAPWILWIKDLAVPDPWFILPLVMAGTMFLQVRLNPKPPDPVQAKVMMMMPIIFSVMFFFFPAGLVLYWLVNNIYSIAQQWTITRTIEKAAAAKKK